MPTPIAEAIAAARALRPADADRLQDDHRLRRADQAGQGLHARRAARRRRDQGRAREARLGACRRSRCRATCWRPGAPRARAAPVSARPGSSARPSLRRARSARSDRYSRRSRPSRLPSPRSRRSSPPTPPKLATRQSSQKVLEKLVPALPALIGGSADLTGSNGTRTKHHTAVSRRRLRRQLHPLRRARARHGGGHERAGAARRHRAVRRRPSWSSPTTAGRRSGCRR